MHRAINTLLHVFMAAPAAEEVRPRTIPSYVSRTCPTRVSKTLSATAPLIGSCTEHGCTEALVQLVRSPWSPTVRNRTLVLGGANWGTYKDPGVSRGRSGLRALARTQPGTHWADLAQSDTRFAAWLTWGRGRRSGAG